MPSPYLVSMNKSSASYYIPVSVRILRLATSRAVRPRRMDKFSSVLLERFLNPTSGPNACSMSSLCRPKSGTLSDITDLFLLVCRLYSFASLFLRTSFLSFHCFFAWLLVHGFFFPNANFRISMPLQWSCTENCLSNYACFASQTPGFVRCY